MISNIDLIAHDGSSLRVLMQSQRHSLGKPRDTLLWLEGLHARHWTALLPVTMLSLCVLLRLWNRIRYLYFFISRNWTLTWIVQKRLLETIFLIMWVCVFFLIQVLVFTWAIQNVPIGGGQLLNPSWIPSYVISQSQLILLDLAVPLVQILRLEVPVTG